MNDNIAALIALALVLGFFTLLFWLTSRETD